MTSIMDNFRANIELAKEGVARVLEDDDALSLLSLKELDEAIATKFALATIMSCPLGWEERTDETNRVKDRYLALQTDEVDKVNACFFIT